MEVNLTAKRVAEIVELSSVKTMKKLESKAFTGAASSAFRKGKAGSFKEGVTDEQKAWAVEQYEKELAPLGVPSCPP